MKTKTLWIMVVNGINVAQITDKQAAVAMFDSNANNPEPWVLLEVTNTPIKANEAGRKSLENPLTNQD